MSGYRDTYVVEPLPFQAGVLLSLRGKLSKADGADILSELGEQHGAVLVRGFDVGLEGFVSISDSLSSTVGNYRGGGLQFGPFARPVIDADRGVMGVTGGSQNFPMCLHGEMYYLGNRPDLIWFHCIVAPARGGETTLGSGRTLYRRLSPATRAFCEDEGIVYHRTLRDGDWQTTFETENLSDVEAFCSEQSTSFSFNETTGAVETDFNSSFIRRDGDGEPVFINNVKLLIDAEQAFQSGAARELAGVGNRTCPIVVRLADGSRIPEAIIEDIARVQDEVTWPITWQQGDIAMIDNRSVMHGRRECGAGERNIAVRLTSIG